MGKYLSGKNSRAISTELLLIRIKHYAKNVSKTPAIKPIDIFKQSDLVEGGYDIAPSA